MPGEDRGEERGSVVDIAAIEAGRDRTSVALERLVRAGAEAQAELALLRAQHHGAPRGQQHLSPRTTAAPDHGARSARAAWATPGAPSETAPADGQAAALAPHEGVGPGATGPRTPGEASHLRSVASALHQDHDATLALTEAVRTELSVLFHAKGAAEAERDAALAEIDAMRVEAAGERARVKAEHERVIAQLGAYEARVRDELAILESQVSAQQDQLSSAEAALAAVLAQRERAGGSQP